MLDLYKHIQLYKVSINIKKRKFIEGDFNAPYAL